MTSAFITVERRQGLLAPGTHRTSIVRLKEPAGSIADPNRLDQQLMMHAPYEHLVQDKRAPTVRSDA